MKEKIKKILLLSLSLFILSLFITLSLNDVEARQGCCSWHGGVCGCQCCDGTPLSATCAPYYPQCNTYTAEIPKGGDDGGSIWWWIIGIGFVGYLFYAFKKKK